MLLPEQGNWNEADFLALHTNRMAELVAGRLEVLPMPTWLHQLIVEFLHAALKSWLQANGVGGRVLFAPLPLRLFPGTIREPDLLYVAPENLPENPRGYPVRADFVIEVVSAGDEARRRDYEEKRSDYAQAGIAEYWIVDPERRVIEVLGLADGAYKSLGSFREGQTARGRYFAGFVVDVAAVMGLGKTGPA